VAVSYERGTPVEGPPPRVLLPSSGRRCWVQGSGFRVQGSGFRVQGSEFRVQLGVRRGLDRVPLGFSQGLITGWLGFS